MIAFALAAALALTTVSPEARAIGIGDSLGISPFRDWRTLETDHFRITYHDGLAELAPKAADYLEEAYHLVTPQLYWEPSTKTQILLIDNADSANGLTSAAGRFGIVLYSTPPENWFSIGYYDDWLRLLCIHEYTHLVNLDTTHGLYPILRGLFGDVVVPNSLSPTWMLEGLAVYNETRFTRAGRGRSPYYEALLRAAVADGTLGGPFVPLDRVNGDNPWFPGGETPYLFGYSLMNQVARSKMPEGHRTADGEDSLRDGEDALGLNSWRSGGRVPWFINGNLENITGRDWYSYWDEWLAETQARMSAQIRELEKSPVTRPEKITTEGYQAFGSAFSPDGRWLAYTQYTQDRRSGLYLRDLSTGETRRANDKLQGVGLRFTSDSRSLIYSESDKFWNYSLFSDLWMLDLERGSTRRLTDGVRAKDPDLSPDGKLLAFTVTEGGRVALATAPFTGNAIGEIRKVFVPGPLQRVSNPKFSPDGRSIVFSLHRNEGPHEELARVPVDGSSAPELLVSNGRFNRFPVYSPKGELFFVSDLSGVDNVYRYVEKAQPEPVTNLVTAAWLPSFSPKGELHASVLSSLGWDIARLPTSAAPTSAPRAVVADAAPAPAPAAVVGTSTQGQHDDRPYSLFPSLWPRQWTPALYASLAQSGDPYFGGNVRGFDALDRHTYQFGLFYDTGLSLFDWTAAYSNRQLGASIDLSVAKYTDDSLLFSTGELLYTRKLDTSIGVSFPFKRTWSTFTPSLTLNADRTVLYQYGFDDPLVSAVYAPSVDAQLVASNAETSTLAIGSERGRTVRLGSRAYADSGVMRYKGVFSYQEFVPVGNTHAILMPAIRAVTASRPSPRILESSAFVRGRVNRPAGAQSNLLDELSLRGYPNLVLTPRAAAIGSLDFRFPLFRVFRGIGTYPLFFENLWMQVFAESLYVPNSPTRYRPSAGAGLRLNAQALIQVPLQLLLDYQKGFANGGESQIIGQVALGSLNFF